VGIPELLYLCTRFQEGKNTKVKKINLGIKNAQNQHNKNAVRSSWTCFLLSDYGTDRSS
jgi:hypothetical protein